MSNPASVATPSDFLPRYGCPFCSNLPLTYDAETNPDTHETGATCDRCGARWIITATSTLPDATTGGGAGHNLSMTRVESLEATPRTVASS